MKPCPVDGRNGKHLTRALNRALRRMTTPPITTFEEFRDALVAYRLPRVLITALELDLFTAIGPKKSQVSELAAALKVSERGLAILCRNLAAVGLLRKSGDTYWNSKLAARALNAGSPAYRGAYLELLRNHWADWSCLTGSVKTGLPVDHDEPEEPGYREQFTWAMHHRSLEVAPKVAAQVNLKGARTLLDLGGGPGTYAMAFLAKNPQLRATVCDRPAALEVARKIAATHKASHRLSYQPLDFMQDPIAGQYDVIWYSNVLHIYSPDQNQALFRLALPALSPGGRLIVQDAFLHDREGLYPFEAGLFAVTMLLFTETGNTYSLADTVRWLREAGFERVRPIRMRKGMEDWDGGLLEASRPVVRPEKLARPRRSAENSRGR